MNNRHILWEKEKLPKILNSFPPRIRDCIELTKIQKLPEVKNNYIFGVARTGKTILACSMTVVWTNKRFIERKSIDFYFSATINLIENLRIEYNNSCQSLIDKCKNSSLLIIDDIGAEKLSEWAYSQLYMIIDHRYNYYLPTIYTSNLSLAELANKFQDDRIVSRIGEMCKNHIIQLTNQPYL
jgi:DNA replication protein DnaC